MNREAFIASFSQYGPLYEICWPDPPGESTRAQFTEALIAWMRACGFVCNATPNGRCIDVTSNMYDNYPDLALEWVDEGILMVCYLGRTGYDALGNVKSLLDREGLVLKSIVG